MKSSLLNSAFRNTLIRSALIVLIGLTSLPGIQGQSKKVYTHDYLMPQKGKSMVELYSGIPYVAIGQYAYGFSNRVSVGVIYGYTPFEKGYGLRVKALVGKPTESFRMSIKSPLIYYPGMKNGENEPWALAWPAFNGEWKFKNGSRVWTGVGVIGAACVEYLFKPGGHADEDHEHHGGHHPHEGHGPHGPNVDPTTGTTPMPPKEEEDMFSIFNTFQFGYSKPLSNNWSFVAEVAPVMEGFKLKSPNGFLDTAPVIVTLGLTCSF